MPDELLTNLDRSFARVSEAAPAAAVPRGIARPTGAKAAAVPRTRSNFRERYPLVEIFVAAQFLWGALLFLPGAQTYRAAIRALPYLSSVLLLVVYLTKRTPETKAPGSMSFIVAAR